MCAGLACSVSPNAITFNSLISALAAGALYEAAADVAFSHMARRGVAPDVVTFTALIGAFDRGGQWRRALQVRQMA